MKAKPSEWDDAEARFKDVIKYKIQNDRLRKIKFRAEGIFSKMLDELIEEDKELSFEEFKAKFTRNDGKKEENKFPDTLLGFLQFYMDFLLERERIGDYEHYKKLLSVLKQYGVAPTVKLKDIDAYWMKNFETYLTKRKNPRTGKPIKKVSVRDYMKHLSTLFSKAIDDFGVIEEKPFKKGKVKYSYAHLKSPRISKSISDDAINRFFSFKYQEYDVQYQKTYLILLFIYLFRGISIADAARLTVHDISNDEIVFGRIKTNNKVPNIPLNEERRKVIEELRPYTDQKHLVPILEEKHVTEQQKRNRIHRIKQLVNKCGKEIAKIQGVDNNISTYVMKHTFSRQVLTKYGIWALKETHGHKSVETTQAYADSLSNQEIAKVDSVFKLALEGVPN